MDRFKKGVKQSERIVIAAGKRILGIGAKEAKRRLSICNGCELKERDEEFGGFMCGHCFCNLKTLAYDKEGCELGKWNK